jgi:hypothetical protein
VKIVGTLIEHRNRLPLRPVANVGIPLNHFRTHPARDLLMIRTRGEISLEEFQEANEAFRDKIRDVEEKIRSVASARATAGSFVRFAELQLADFANIWRRANPEQRERVQNLLFQGGWTIRVN